MFGHLRPILTDSDQFPTVFSRFSADFNRFSAIFDLKPPQNAHFSAYFASTPVLFRPFRAIFARNSADFKQRPDGFFRFLAVKCEIGARVFSGPPQN
jgi:hypothetical protein